MAFRIKNNVYWVGKVDWELRRIHGEEYSTHRGSTYNSYLIKEKKIALIDTVWQPFAEEFVKTLKDQVDLKATDYVIANHAAKDHSGAVHELLNAISGKPPYWAAHGAESPKGHYTTACTFQVVKDGR